MSKHLLTLLLILTVLVPTSLFGFTVHHCGRMDSGSMDAAEMPSCCSQAFQQNDGTAQVSHQCDIAHQTAERQPATTAFKTQFETFYPVEFLPVSLVPFPSSDSLSRFPAGAFDFPFTGSCQPVFLRNCSFLI